ncbi:hypothetical protein [Bradyrhizobium sp. 164]|uniref:hypothetical protein n=1 Tax=Bradyrhizobium sp. 164 TaxID=2782637 RepID=UPI001FF95543|nr:hypothetical protein [Bradyrhizobium sp. 164]MCK1599351.1 hypothetical protein [Bradyrhizobium sp. 164]
MSEEPIRGEQDHNHCGREVTSLKKDDTSDPRDEEHDLPEQGEPEISFAGWDAIAHTDHLCILAIGGAPQVDPSGLRRAHGNTLRIETRNFRFGSKCEELRLSKSGPL